jgi:hypothetical protein
MALLLAGGLWLFFLLRFRRIARACRAWPVVFAGYTASGAGFGAFLLLLLTGMVHMNRAAPAGMVAFLAGPGFWAWADAHLAKQVRLTLVRAVYGGGDEASDASRDAGVTPDKTRDREQG